jgi:hypothetical protein
MRGSDLTGQRFGRLVVVRFAGLTLLATGRHGATWVCECDCGTVKVVRARYLLRGQSRSCGCLRSETVSARASTQFGGVRAPAGAWRTPEYVVLVSMWARCENPNNKDFRRYGARGITVCQRWRKGENGKSPYECFIEDMGRRPSPELSIDRIDNDGNYEPGNCRWATPKQQQLNRRKRAP